jgi:hypothetical protein
MSQKSEEFLTVFLVRTRDKRAGGPISKYDTDPRSFEGYRVDLMEMHVPVNAKIGEGDAKDSIVSKDNNLFFSREILSSVSREGAGLNQMENVIVSEVFGIACLTKSVLTVG